MEKIIINIDNTFARIDAYIGGHCEISRQRAKKLMIEGLILLNGAEVKPKHSLKPGDVIEINIPAIVPLDVVAQEMNLDIVYEDADVILINKANNVVVHPAPGHPNGTLVNGLLNHCKDLSGINGVERPGVVHRIDKMTTGILMFAKNDKAHQGLAKQLEDKSATRRYVALVQGVIEHESAEIDAPIGRDGSDRKKMCVTDKNAKLAKTHLVVLKRFKKFTLIELKLETGRTHQIRVHMSWIGHPIVGDHVYGKKKENDPFGQYLHAKTLGFIHPTTNDYMEFTSELPKEFTDKLEEIERVEGLN